MHDIHTSGRATWTVASLTAISPVPTKLELGSSETLKQWPDKIFSPAVQPEF
jgi:hypothetical protein